MGKDWRFLFGVVWLTTHARVFSQTVTNENLLARDGKALSVFQVVKFPNKGCIGSSSLNGTCYTASECTNKGGISGGSCASGFGVCCTFTLGCGGQSSENCTYFQSSSSTQPGGQCGVTICKCNSDICQLRIDMNTFVIAGPSTPVAVVGFEAGGSTTYAAPVAVSQKTNCLTDIFTITGPGGSNPPVICGTNSGYHVYVDASSACNMLNFQLGPTGIGTTIPTRQWNLKITQISCHDPNRAPSGCTQYMYGSTSGTISTFNRANTFQLGNQQQTVCIRRERGYCRICYSATKASDFQVSGMATAIGFNKDTNCCGYGSKGVNTMGYDCVVIPGAMTMNKAISLTVLPQNFCGGGGLATARTQALTNGGKTVCSRQTPFQLEFLSDSYSYAISNSAGFTLTYFETACP